MPVDLRITVDTSGVEAYLGELRDQAPRRVGFALNRTASAVQRAIQHSLAGRFRLRRTAFVTRTIYRKPREDFPQIKQTPPVLEAAVRVHDERDFLAKFEEGGEKREQAGGLRVGGRLAVPVIRQSQPSLIITKGHRWNLRNLGAGLFQRGRSSKGRYFGVVSKTGLPLIFERVGRRSARVIWALVRSVPIPRRLGFFETANNTTDRIWPSILKSELDEALRRAAAKAQK